MSLRNRSVSDGKGPTVSLGVTAQAALLPAPVVGVAASVVGLVGDSPQPNASAAPAAPSVPSASRRPIFLCFNLGLLAPAAL